MQQNKLNETTQLLRDYRAFVTELQHILYRNAADSEELDIKIADFQLRAAALLGEAVQCEACEQTCVPIIRVEVSDGEGPPNFLAVCSDACLRAVTLRFKHVCEIIRPE